MHEQYKSFLDWFLSVALYSCDQTDEAAMSMYSEEQPPLNLRKLEVTSAEFFEQLYESRDTLDVIRHHLNSRTNLICLVGPRGSGKSTIAQKLLTEVQAERKESKAAGSFIVFLDLKVEANTNNVDLTDPTTIENSLRARLASQYREELFPLTLEGENPRLKLWAFLLDRAFNDQKPMPIFSAFQALQDEATLMLRQYFTSHDKVSVEAWLEDTLNYEIDVHSLVREVDKLIDFHHLAFAAYSVAKIRQQTIWFDNLDRFDEKEQTDAMIAVRRLLTPVSRRVNMGVSIREENVFRDHELWDDGASPFDTRVMLQLPKDSRGHVFYPSADIPLAKDNELRNIMSKRLTFTRNYHANAVRQLKSRIGGLESRGDPTDDVKIGILKEELEKIGSVITPQRFAIVEELSTKLLDAMLDEKAILLANNSLRDFMFIFRDCLADLFSNAEGEQVPATKYQPWYVATLFLRRARHAQRRYKMGVYDVLASTSEWYEQGQSGVGCLLPHVIITCVWNLILKGKDNNLYRRTPRVGDVVSSLSQIGYDRETVVNGIHALYSHYFGRQSLLEFRDRSIIGSPDRITDDAPIYLTYRAKCLVGRTSGSFGYLYDCLRLLRGGSDTDEAFIEHPYIRSTEEAVTALLPHLCDVAQMHLLALREIQSRGIFKAWPQAYYKAFSVPFDEQYSRIGRREPMLQLEVILHGLLGYVKHHDEASKSLRSLLNSFSAAIHQAPDDSSPNFRNHLGLGGQK